MNDYLGNTPCPPNLFGIVTKCNIYLWPYGLGSNLLARLCLVWQVPLLDQALIQFLIANTLGAALGDGKKLVNRFMAGKPKIAPRSRSAKIPPVSITPRRRGRPSTIIPIACVDCLSRLVIAVLSLGSGYALILIKVLEILDPDQKI